MPTTSNFGWTTPADTDLVKDGAAAIRTLGNGVDSSFVDLKGGTTGQVLSKASNTDLDYSWVTPNVGDITEVQAGTGISVASGTGPIPVVTNTVATAYDAKGDLIVGTGADTFAKLTVGTNGHTLVADSAETTGLKWQAPAAAAFVGCSVYQSSGQSIANDTWTNLTFGAEHFDTDGFHSTSTNTSRITIPTGKGGKYLFVATVTWNTNSSGDRTVTFATTGSGISANGTRVPGVSNNDSMINASAILNLTAGDYVECQVQQKSGGSLSTAAGGSGNVTFSCVYLGA